MPHGRPARQRVTKLSAARPSAPASNGHGPRNQEAPGVEAIGTTSPYFDRSADKTSL
jgi:hypothetical protein